MQGQKMCDVGTCRNYPCVEAALRSILCKKYQRCVSLNHPVWPQQRAASHYCHPGVWPKLWWLAVNLLSATNKKNSNTNLSSRGELLLWQTSVVSQQAMSTGKPPFVPYLHPTLLTLTHHFCLLMSTNLFSLDLYIFHPYYYPFLSEMWKVCDFCCCCTATAALYRQLIRS